MFDLPALTASIHANGPTARVVIAGHEGSSPREAGTAMLVWSTGHSGTIGGGALEWAAIKAARGLLPQGAASIQRTPLGPALGQCCGGAVTLVTEVFTAQTLPKPQSGLIARGLDGSDMPLAVGRMLSQARAQGQVPPTRLIQGWLVEPVVRQTRPIWVWGAGHVGRALVDVLSPLPDLALTWIDIAPHRFPATVAPQVRVLPASDPVVAVSLAPHDAEHVIVTFSHTLDLDLCHRLLSHGFASCGLIGSHTKWARFKGRLAALGHSQPDIARISCPIGLPQLGKHPQAIAIGVAAEFLSPRHQIHAQEHLG